MTYVRPAIERRVPVRGPVITAVAAGSSVTATPAWTNDDAPDAGTEES